MTRGRYYRLLKKYHKLTLKENQKLGYWNRCRLTYIQNALTKWYTSITHDISNMVLASDVPAGSSQASMDDNEIEKLKDIGNRISELQRKIVHGELIAPEEYENTFIHI